MLAGLPYFPHRPPVLRGVWGSGPQGGMGAVLPVQGDATLSRAASPTRYPSPPQSPHHPSSLALGRGARYLAQHLPPQQPARCIISFSLGGGADIVCTPPQDPPAHTRAPTALLAEHPHGGAGRVLGGQQGCWGGHNTPGGDNTKGGVSMNPFSGFCPRGAPRAGRRGGILLQHPIPPPPCFPSLVFQNTKRNKVQGRLQL